MNASILLKIRMIMRFFTILLVLFSTGFLQVGAVSDDFARYQGILDRKPFGEPPPDPSQMTNAMAVADLFTKTLKMVAIKQEQNGRIRVGFVNQAAGNKSYYLMVGETSSDGIELVDADFELESALLKKGSQSNWIYMNSSPQKPEVAPAGTAPSSFSSSSMAKAVQQKRVSLYSELLRRRREGTGTQDGQPAGDAASTPKIPDGKMSGEQLEKHLKEYQMEAIRKGLKPLPIPLTKEMDDQLVSEGVLPPLPQAPMQTK